MNKRLLPSSEQLIANSLLDQSKRLRNQESRERVPIGTIILRKDSNQSISSTLASTTAIQWDTLQSGLGFTWVIGSSTKIFSAGQRSGERFEITGVVRWDTGNTGRRECYLKVYTVAAALRDTIPLHGVVTDNGGNMILPFATIYEWVDPTDYFQIEVAHNQGAGLNVNFARLGAKIVR